MDLIAQPKMGANTFWPPRSDSAFRRKEFRGGYGTALRVTDDSVHFTGPLASKLPIACQFAAVPGSTLATADKPSPTLLPAESVNFTWIVYRLDLLL